MAISAFATASRVLASERPPPVRAFPVEARPPRAYLDAALKVWGQVASGRGVVWRGVAVSVEATPHARLEAALKMRAGGWGALVGLHLLGPGSAWPATAAQVACCCAPTSQLSTHPPCPPHLPVPP